MNDNIKIGIYCIKNKINGKVYIGSSKNIDKRWKKHKYCLAGGYHENEHLQNSYNIYSKDNFEFLILEECKEEELIEKEQYYLNAYKSCERDKGYNICPQVNKTQMAEETKRKISNALKGEKSPMFGTHLSEETKKKLRDANKGKTLSEQTRKKIGDVQKGDNNHAAKLTWPIVEEIREKYKTGEYSTRYLAKVYNIGCTAICYVINNKTWKQTHIEPQEPQTQQTHTNPQTQQTHIKPQTQQIIRPDKYQTSTLQEQTNQQPVLKMNENNIN